MGLITPSDISFLKNNPESRILSVGTGPGLLEETLIEMGVKPNQITVSDINMKDIPPTFQNKFQFDMWKQWPTITTAPFDLIIFPESASSLTRTPFDNRIEVFVNMSLQAASLLTSTGTIRMDGVQLAIDQPEDIATALALHGISFSYNDQTSLVTLQRIEQTTS